MKLPSILFKLLVVVNLIIIFGCNRSSGPTDPPAPPPTVPVQLQIISVNPTHGTPGTSVTINGIGFTGISGKDTVLFNGIIATVTTASSTQLVVIVPNQGSSGKITIRSGGRSVDGPMFTYDIIPTGPPPVEDSFMVSTFAGNHTDGSQNGIGVNASFSFVWGLAADSTGNILVADGGNNLIRKITPDGVVSTLAGAGSKPSSSGSGTFFYYPVGVAADQQNGKVYVANQAQHLIQIITAPETVSLLAGSGRGIADGTGTTASFDEPTSLVADADGNVFVADRRNNAIRKITPSGVVTTFAGATGAIPGDVDGVGTAALFYQPSGIAIDKNGNLYVADAGNNKIRKITPNRVVTTLAGVGNGSGSRRDGPGNIATFAFPKGVAVDSKNNVYVADEGNNVIRKITPDGIVSTIAGTGMEGANDGPGKSATFNSPMGVAVDNKGNIFVADGSNYVIRKITAK